jgi:hypothetical protein
LKIRIGTLGFGGSWQSKWALLGFSFLLSGGVFGSFVRHWPAKGLSLNRNNVELIWKIVVHNVTAQSEAADIVESRGRVQVGLWQKVPFVYSKGLALYAVSIIYRFIQ